MARRAGRSEMIGPLLRRAGLAEEALALDAPGLLTMSERLLARGNAVSAASDDYPPMWLDRLSDGAPPALWMKGRPPRALPLIALVGSRAPSSEAAKFARAVVAAAGDLGRGIVSGGAGGCDRIAVEAAVRLGAATLEILPCGIGMGFGFGNSMLSACGPGAEFSVAAAMERNALVYAAAEAAVVVQPRFKHGGAWLGAVDALRRRLCPVIVWAGEDSLAVRALRGLGATGVSDPSQLLAALEAAPAQGELALPRRKPSVFRIQAGWAGPVHSAPE